MWFVLCLLLLLLGVLAWLTYTGRVSVSEWAESWIVCWACRRRSGMSRITSPKSPLSSGAASAWAPPAEPEAAAPRAEPPRRVVEESPVERSAPMERETIVLPKRQAAPPQPAPELPTLELSREYRKRQRQPAAEPQAKICR